MPRKSKEKEDIKELNSVKDEVKKRTKTRTKKEDKTNDEIKSDVKVKKVSKTKKADVDSTTSEVKEKKTRAKKVTTSSTKSSKKSSEVDSTTPEVKEKKTRAKKATTSSTKSSKKSSEVDSTTPEVKEKKTRAKKTTSSTSKKASSKKSISAKATEQIEVLEYYDLPYRYNQTTVKILAQTPTTLFVYWDISDDDRQNFIKQYGKNFFEETKPVLRIYNETKDYSFEVDINDFANSWYIHITESKCTYNVELGRKPIAVDNPTIKPIANNYIYITSSNELESPNGHILFDELGDTVYFRNVKTNIVEGKKITSISFMQKMDKIYNIYDIYKKMYPNEDIGNIKNPSSGMF